MRRIGLRKSVSDFCVADKRFGDVSWWEQGGEPEAQEQPDEADACAEEDDLSDLKSPPPASVDGDAEEDEEYGE